MNAGRYQGAPAEYRRRRSQSNEVQDNADVENLTLIIFPPSSLSGRLSIDGQPLTTLTSLDRMRVQLVPLGDTTSFIGNAQSQSQPPTPDGTFKVENLLPGAYRAMIMGMWPGYYLKSVRLEETEGLDQPLRVLASTAGAATTLSSVLTEARLTARSSTISSSLWYVTLKRYSFPMGDGAASTSTVRREAMLTDTSLFVVFPPATKSFPWEVLEQFAYYDSDVENLRSEGELVRVSDSSTQSVEVRIIPPLEP